jgi:hypothetical protein
MRLLLGGLGHGTASRVLGLRQCVHANGTNRLKASDNVKSLFFQ